MEIELRQQNNLINKKNNNAIFLLSFSVLFLMFFLRDLQIFSINPILFLVYTTIMFMFFDKSQSLALFFSLCIIGTGMQYLYAILIGLFIFIFKNFYEFKINYKNLLPILAILWELCHLPFFKGELVEFFRWSSGFLIIFLLISIPKEDLNYRLILKTVSIVVILTNSIIFINALKFFNWNISNMVLRGYRFGHSYAYPNLKYIMTGNPNRLGGFCNFGIAIELVLLLTNTKGKQYLGSIVRMILLALFGFMTLSRAFILVFFVMIILSLLISKIKFKKKITLAFIFLFVIIFSIVLINKIAPESIENLLFRFDAEDISSGRLEGNSVYINILLENVDWFLFGISTQNIIPTIASRGYNYVFVPHNGTIEMFVCFGALGSFIMIGILLSLIFDAVNYKKGYNQKFEFYLLLPMLIYIINAQSIQLLKDPSNIILLGMSYLILFMPARITKKETNFDRIDNSYDSVYNNKMVEL